MAVDPLPHEAPDSPLVPLADLDETRLLEGPWAADSPPPDDMVLAALRVDLYAMLTPLTARERRILHLRLGLVEDRPCSVEEVARRLGLPVERVRQLERQGMAKLRHTAYGPGFVSYLG